MIATVAAAPSHTARSTTTTITAILSTILHRSMPFEITLGMRVGPGLLGLLERLRDGAVGTVL